MILDWNEVTQEDPLDTSRSKTKQGKLNQNINQQARRYISEALLPRLIELMGATCKLAIDTEDPHTINITYPKAFESEYLRPQVRLEIGPLAAMLPMEMRTLKPYAAQYFPEIFTQSSIAVPTIVAKRTFWEKLTILHAEAHRPNNKNLPDRYARHYYDVYKLVETGISIAALDQYSLLEEVVSFKKKFYPSGWANYDSATLTSLKLLPAEHHFEALKRDYTQMQEMLFGQKPKFEDIISLLSTLEKEVHTLGLKAT